MKINFAHICESAFIIQNGTPGVIGIFSRIKSQALPAFRDNTTIIVNFGPNDKKQHIVSVSGKSPSGIEIVKPVDQKVGPSLNENSNLGMILEIKNIEFNEVGRYLFEIFIDGNKLGILPLDLELLK